jgi:outer membrane lipoprotein SlyB
MEKKIYPNDTMDEVVVHASEQHINPDGDTDAKKGAQLGGVGGAVTGALAGSMVGPAGAVLGAAIGGVVGAVTSGLAVAQVDKVDGDSKNDAGEDTIVASEAED